MLTPVLCRLCRRPVPRAVTKCPSCRARLVWSPSAPRAGSNLLLRWAGRLGMTGLAAAVVAGVVLVVVWGWMLREVKAPVSSADTTKAAARPSSAECASLVGILLGGPEPRNTPETREKIRQCFQRR